MNNFQNIRDNTTLSPEKKNQMWASIAHKIELSEISSEKNVRDDSVNRHTLGGANIAPSPLLPKKKFMNNAKILATMILILGAIVGTASYAAEQSLPGEALYAFKLGVNESVRGAFTFGAEADAKWEIEKIERRNEEKAKLQAEAKLTAEANAEIKSRSENSAEKVQGVIARLKAEGKAEAATSLEGGLNMALSAILSSDHENNNSETPTDTDTRTKTNVKVSVPDLDVKLNGRGTSDSDTHTKSNNSSHTESDTDAAINLDLHGSANSESDSNSSGTSSNGSNNSSNSNSDVDVDASVDADVNIDLGNSHSSSNSDTGVSVDVNTSTSSSSGTSLHL